MDLQERIIIEAGTLFARYGIRSITMDTLAEDMGISKRTIYENFKDKDTLLLEVVVYYKEQQMKETNEIFESSDNVVEAMFKILEKTINNMKQVNPILFHDMKKYHSQIFKQISEKGSFRDHSITERVLREGTEQGIFTSGYNMEIVNHTLHELFNMFTPDSNLTTLGYHRGELFQNTIVPYLMGLATEKGRKLIQTHSDF